MEKSSAEDYREAVTSIRLRYGGDRSLATEISVQKNENGARAVLRNYPSADTGFEENHLSADDWKLLMDQLFTDLCLHDWKRRYVSDDPDPGMMDGTKWDLNIRLTGNRQLVYHGENEYPPYWDKLCTLLMNCVRNK